MLKSGITDMIPEKNVLLVIDPLNMFLDKNVEPNSMEKNPPPHYDDRVNKKI